MNKNKHGGARRGAGRKEKYGEPTVTVSFRVPLSKAPAIKTIVNKKLLSYENQTNKGN